VGDEQTCCLKLSTSSMFICGIGVGLSSKKTKKQILFFFTLLGQKGVFFFLEKMHIFGKEGEKKKRITKKPLLFVCVV
jgi:hypothetical protein